jgi:hypothetical protein
MVYNIYDEWLKKMYNLSIFSLRFDKIHIIEA